MISCVQRSEAREKTLPQLHALGIHPEVFLSPCNPAGPRGNAEVSARALSATTDTLFLEDDIDVSPTFVHFLSLAKEKQAVTYFYAHDGNDMLYTYGVPLGKRIKSGEKLEPGLYPVWKAHKLYHSQAVYLPSFVLETLDTKRMKDQGKSFDVWLTKWLRKHKHQAYVALPHPVGHRNDVTARNRGPNPLKTSRTFSWP